mmetsp:Transcript_2710/g.7957  ORF Transcript_2710/g.7957 Transcript_2710/m.7957 type:complete len:110 (-) Transcript_2710:386-715(-)
MNGTDRDARLLAAIEARVAATGLTDVADVDWNRVAGAIGEDAASCRVRWAQLSSAAVAGAGPGGAIASAVEDVFRAAKSHPRRALRRRASWTWSRAAKLMLEFPPRIAR